MQFLSSLRAATRLGLAAALLLVWGSHLEAYAQSPNWQWGHRLGGSTSNSPSGYYDQAARPAADAAGNTYVTGGYDSPATFSGSATTLPHAGQLDVMVAKYDSLGRLRWARGAGGTRYDTGAATACDLSGNVFVVGITETGFTFPGTVLGPSGGGGFVAKLDSTGAVLWAKRIGSRNAGVLPGSAAVDGFGNCLVLASRADSLTIGGVRLPRPSNGTYDFLLISYDVGGTVNWVRTITPSAANGNLGADRAAVATDLNGNVYVSGTVGQGTVQIGPGIQSGITASYGLFLAKYNSAGVPQWVRTVPLASAGGLAAEARGRFLYLCGEATRGATFGSIGVTPVNNEEAFVSRFSPQGTFAWVRTGGGPNVPNLGQGVAVNRRGDTFLAAAVGDSPAVFGNTSFSWPFATYRTVVVRYDSTGVVRGGLATTLESAKPSGIALSGDFAPVVTFDSYRTVGLGTAPSIMTQGLFDMGLARADFRNRLLSVRAGTVDAASWVLFPNPARESVRLRLPVGVLSATMRLADLQGREVVVKRVDLANVSVPLPRLATGVYLVTLVPDGGQPASTHRLVVE